MKVLVTGASSLLGGAVARALTQRGDDVVCFQRRSSNLDLAEILGDVRDLENFSRASQGCDAVVHLAALVGPKLPWADAYDVNVTGAVNATTVARGCGRFVHVSTPSVAFHNVASVGSLAESPTYDGSDAYARSKALGERMVLEQSSVPTVVLRPHLVWGPGDTQLVGRIVERARQGRLVLPDGGRALIDSTYIDDAARAVVAGLDRTEENGEACGQAWVVTGGDPRPLAELVEAIVDAAGVSTPLRSLPAPLVGILGRLVGRCWPNSEPPLTHFAARQLSVAHWFDQSETRRVLQWEPKVTVDEGMGRLKAWFETQGAPN